MPRSWAASTCSGKFRPRSVTNRGVSRLELRCGRRVRSGTGNELDANQIGSGSRDGGLARAARRGRGAGCRGVRDRPAPRLRAAPAGRQVRRRSAWAHDRPAARRRRPRDRARPAGQAERRLRRPQLRRARLGGRNRNPSRPRRPGTIEAVTGSSTTTTSPGGWATRQWDFLDYSGTPTSKLPTSPGGIDAVGAWANLEAEGRPGAQGIVVAVLDSGVAYRDYGSQYLRSPDFSPEEFVPGDDFVDHDRLPLDENGHGTFVAGTIAEQTNNGIGLTGLAYNAKLMPVRVLGRNNIGFANRIAEGIRFAVAHHAQVINMSFNFDCGEKVPQVDEALREAYAHGVVTVGLRRQPLLAASSAKSCVSEPATGPRVIGVGGTTEGGCMGSYSLAGKGIDVVAPGGGKPAAGCPSVLSRPIYQVTLKQGTTNQFTIPSKYDRHLDGGGPRLRRRGDDPRLRRHPAGPEAESEGARGDKRLKVTARSLGYPRTQQGAGLIDAARAEPGAPEPHSARRRA